MSFCFLFFLFDCVSFHFLFLKGSLHAGRSKVTRVRLVATPTKVLEFVELIFATLKVAINRVLSRNRQVSRRPLDYENVEPEFSASTVWHPRKRRWRSNVPAVHQLALEHSWAPT